jgi:hypothetical protein
MIFARPGVNRRARSSPVRRAQIHVPRKPQDGGRHQPFDGAMQQPICADAQFMQGASAAEFMFTNNQAQDGSRPTTR